MIHLLEFIPAVRWNMPIFQNFEEEETIPDEPYKASITFTTKPEKNTKRKKLQVNISDEYRN